MNLSLKKIGIAAGLLALLSSGAVIAQLPLPLLQWAKAVTESPELLELIDGSPKTYDGEPVVDVLPVKGRTDRVLVLFPARIDSTTNEVVSGMWLEVDRSAWDRFAEME